MKTLILSDVHDKIDCAQFAINLEKPDKIIFLGDQWDSWDDTVTICRKTTDWVKEKLNDKRCIFLGGNHDLSYIYSHNPFCRCSGFSIEKKIAIHDILTKEDFDKFKLFHIDNGILFSHAGLSASWLKEYIANPFEYTLDNLGSFLQQRGAQCKILLENGSRDVLVGAGFDRGGDQKVGGITWNDFSNHICIPNVFQVVGHSICKVPDFKTLNRDGYAVYHSPQDKYLTKSLFERGASLNLDTNLHHYATIEDDTFNIFEIIHVEQYAEIYKNLEPAYHVTNTRPQKRYIYSKGKRIFSRKLEEM